VVRRDGQSRGFGFITFRDEVSVEKCLLVSHYIRNRKVELKRAVPKVRRSRAAVAPLASCGAVWCRVGTCASLERSAPTLAAPVGGDGRAHRRTRCCQRRPRAPCRCPLAAARPAATTRSRRT
jgi:RNA recognition motif-containing protein